MPAQSKGPLEERARAVVAAARRAPLTAGVLLSVGGAAPVIVVPALYPRIAAELPGFSTAALGLSTSIFFALSSLTAPLAGAVVDRLGRRRAARVATLACIASITAVAASPSVPWLLGVFAGGGVVQGIAMTSSALALSSALGSRRQATQFALKQTSVPALSLLAGLALAVAGGVSWRWIVLAFAAFPAVVLLWRPVDLPPRDPVPAPPSDQPARRRPAPGMLLLIAVGALAGASVSALATFGVVALTRAGWSTGAAGTIYASAAGASLVLRVWSGVWTDRSERHVMGSIAVLLGLGAAGFALVATGTRWGTLVGVIAAYGFGWSYSGLLLFVVARTFPGKVARSTGWLMSGAAVGISLGPAAFSALEALAGAVVAWSAVTLLAMGAAGTAAAASRSTALSAENKPNH